MESTEGRSISGLEWKAEGASIGREGYFRGPLPPGAYQGIVRQLSTR
jgi:hypothetical protein